MIKIPTVKSLVKSGNVVRFYQYHKNELWYRIYEPDDDGIMNLLFAFPVPIEDTGDGVFLAEDKAILFMRYIRKHVEYLSKSEN